MRFRPQISAEALEVRLSQFRPGRIFLLAFGCHLTTDEAHRVAKALLRFAAKLEKEGKK